MSIPGILLGAYMVFVFVYFFWQWNRRITDHERMLSEAMREEIRAAVEKALAEQREEWIAALKTASGEYKCHPDFAEMWAKAEADPTYWAELLSSSRDAYHKQDARHAREVERARLEAKIEALDSIDDRNGLISTETAIAVLYKQLGAALAALEVKGE